MTMIIWQMQPRCTTCTGLIPGAPVNDAQREAYEEIYPYKPPEVESQKPDKK
mgnify:CR=1 FL=1